jgi:hypothetical protein
MRCVFACTCAQQRNCVPTHLLNFENACDEVCDVMGLLYDSLPDKQAAIADIRHVERVAKSHIRHHYLSAIKNKDDPCASVAAHNIEHALNPSPAVPKSHVWKGDTPSTKKKAAKRKESPRPTAAATR